MNLKREMKHSPKIKPLDRRDKMEARREEDGCSCYRERDQIQAYADSYGR